MWVAFAFAQINFVAISDKGDGDFLFTLLHTKALLNKCFPYRVDPFSEWGINHSVKVVSPERALIP